MLLRVEDLRAEFASEAGPVRAVQGVSFALRRGEVLCLVGESGSGKSVTARSIMRLLARPAGRIASGAIWLKGEGESEALNLVELNENELSRLRGRRMAMVFQDPMSALNPYLRVDTQLLEVLSLHTSLRRGEARQRAIESLREVGIAAPERRMKDYPHQLSGGMRQRVLLAMALLCKPELLIADEPTTALDVTIQAQILELIEERRRSENMAVLLISHDLGVVAQVAHRVAVMYAGAVVEEGGVEDVLLRPQHPYTRALLRATPRLDHDAKAPVAIAGTPPSPLQRPSGCAFHPRCEEALALCSEQQPPKRRLPLSPEGESCARSFCCHLEAQP
jgi:oligopeptide/dipeptide ABC transporter ATP-binding protein